MKLYNNVNQPDNKAVDIRSIIRNPLGIVNKDDYDRISGVISQFPPLTLVNVDYVAATGF